MMRGKDYLWALALVVGSLVGFVAMARGEHAPPPRVVELSSATVESLLALPGVGRKRAEAIVAYGKKHGFRRPQDLLRIEGIGRKLYAKLKPWVTVERKAQ